MRMNFIFVSPNFPRTYWNFCDRLKAGGVTVLGIGDAPYESLEAPLKAALTEYYKVPDLADYQQMFKAVAYFSFKYGKIDWIESNNEFWLEQDSRLRKDFNITTGVSSDDIAKFKSKAEMKKYYALAGVPSARQAKVTTLSAARAFIRKTGYPVIVKPEVGVGAAATYKLSNDRELSRFYETVSPVPYVMEEFVSGDIYSYDAIVNSKGEPLFESSAHFPPSIMDIVNDALDLCYVELKGVPAKLRAAGRATVKAFGVKSRFVHLEFFKIDADKPGLGKKGDFIGLEVNMRPAGGYTPDMMDYAHSTDVYRIWADMVTADARLLPEDPSDDHFCVYYGRRDAHDYVHSHDEVLAKYGARIAMCERMPKALAPDMGDVTYTAHAATVAEVREFISFMSAVRH